MVSHSEVHAALQAFNAVRIKVEGIKTHEQQVEAMFAALQAAERERAILKDKQQ